MKFLSALYLILIPIKIYGDSTRPSPYVSDTIAITNIKVVGMDGIGVDKTQNIIISNQKIIEMGPSSRLSIPQHAQIIDGRGKYAMPGLIDMHSHLVNQEELFLNLANGITSVRVMWGDSKILKWRDQIKNGKILGPNIFTTGPILDGNPPMHTGSVVITDPHQAAREVRKEAYAGYDFIKVYNNLLPEVYGAITTTAEELGLPVVGHVPTRVGIDEVWKNQSTIEHWQGLIEFLGGALPQSHSDSRRIDQFVQQTINSGAWNCPTVTVIDRAFMGSVSEMEKWLIEPETRYLHPEIKAMWAHHIDNVRKMENWPTKASLILSQLGPRLIKDIHRRKGRLLIGTDTPNPFVVPGFSIHLELAKFEKSGLSPYEVLVIATKNAAQALGRQDSLGTLEVGKQANLLILDKDPRQSLLAIKKHLKGVIVFGKWLPSNFLQGKLEEIAEKYKNQKFANKLSPSSIRAAFKKLHFHQGHP